MLPRKRRTWSDQDMKRILAFVARGPALSREVAAALGLPARKVGVYLSRLADRGLVKRGPSVPCVGAGRPATQWEPIAPTWNPPIGGLRSETGDA